MKPYLFTSNITPIKICSTGDGYKRSVEYANEFIAHPERHLPYIDKDNWHPPSEYRKQLGAKVSEFLLWKACKRNYNICLVAPNIKIDTVEERMKFGHDADLYNSDINLHVKSCPIGGIPSWLFNRNFLEKSKQRNINNDWVALTEVDLPRMQIYIRALLPLKKLFQWNVFKNPRKESLINENAAVYLYSLLAKVPNSWKV